MSQTTHEGKGCACIAYLCTIVRICPTLLPSCELCSWLAFAALGTFPTAPLFFGTFSAAAAVRVASFPCGRSKFGFRFRNATFETPQKICPGVGGRGRSPLIILKQNHFTSQMHCLGSYWNPPIKSRGVCLEARQTFGRAMASLCNLFCSLGFIFLFLLLSLLLTKWNTLWKCSIKIWEVKHAVKVLKNVLKYKMLMFWSNFFAQHSLTVGITP